MDAPSSRGSATPNADAAAPEASPASGIVLAEAKQEPSCTGVVAILGAAFCGSTVINLMLGGHSGIFAASEVNRVLQKPETAICSVCEGPCTFWTPALRGRLTLANFYDEIAIAAGRSVICDSSKKVPWLHEIGPHFADRRFVTVAVAKHPVRHVASFVEKAVVNRHSSELDHVLKMIRQYYEEVLLPGEEKVERIYSRFAPARRCDLVVRYEDFAQNPEAALQPVLAAVGLAFEPAMHNLTHVGQHPIGGNSGPIVQSKGRSPSLPAAKKKYKKKGVFLDNSFSDILSLEQIYTVVHHPDAKWLMQRFGYD